MKRSLALILLIVLALSGIMNIAYMADDKVAKYISDLNVFDFNTYVPKATTGTKYRTIGFMASIPDTDYYAYVKMEQYKDEDSTGTNGLPWIKTFFHIPLSEDNAITAENITSVYETFRGKYGGDEEAVKVISEFFANANKPMLLDAVLTLVVDDTVQGSMTVVGGEATFSGTVYKTYDEFVASGIAWSRTTKETVSSEYYNIQLMFEKQPIRTLVPKIMRYYDDGSTEYSASHTFHVGETIAIDASDSYFPTDMVKKTYVWTYKKVGDSGTSIVTKYTPDSPFANPLTEGNYEVTLRTYATYDRAWDSTPVTVPSETTDTTTIKVIPTGEPTLTASVLAQSEYKMASGASTGTVPASLALTFNNIDLKTVDRVEVNLSKKDGSQYQSTTYDASEIKMFTKSFTVAWTGSAYLETFIGSAKLYYKNGTTLDSNIGAASTYIYKDAPNIPPVAKIRIFDADKTVTVGQSVGVSGSDSYDIDGTIVSYSIDVPKIGFSSPTEYADPSFDYTGDFDIYVTVTDDDGASNSVMDTITVEELKPDIEIDLSGTLKENRKVSLNAINLTEIGSAVGENFTWSITPITEGLTASDVKYATLSGKRIDILFKTWGQYLISVRGVNDRSQSDTTTVVVNVSKDYEPVMVIDAFDTIYRNDVGVATIQAYDHSYSNDGDGFSSRRWSYKFDSNNDGSFDDETAVDLGTNTSEIDSVIEIAANSVGRYEITLTRTENFGQPTILTYITAGDYKSATTTKIVEVDNLKPYVNFYDADTKDIDLTVITDFEGDELTDLQTKLSDFKIDAYEDYVDVQYSIMNDKQIIGKNLPNSYYYHETDNVEGIYNTPYIIDYDFAYLEPYESVAYATSDNRLFATFKDYTYTYYESHGVSYSRNTGTKYIKNYDYTFATPIKDIKIRMRTVLVLLENGDLYMLGNDTDLFGYTFYWTEATYLSYFNNTPKLMLSGVEQLEGDDKNVYALKDDGTVWFHGFETGIYYLGGYDFDRDRIYFDVPRRRIGGQDINGLEEGTTEFRQVQGFSDIVKIAGGAYKIVGIDSLGDFYGVGSNVSSIGLCMPTGSVNIAYNWPDNKYYYYNSLPIAEKISKIEGQNYIDVNFINGKFVYMDADLNYYTVRVDGGNYYYTSGSVYVQQVPYTLVVTPYREYPSDSVKIMNDVDTRYTNTYFNGSTVMTYDTTTSSYIPITDAISGANNYYVPGWNIEGTDVNDFLNETFRDGSERYMLYVGNNNTLQTMPESVLTFAEANGITAIACTDATNLSSKLLPEYVSLSELLGSNPNNGLHGEAELDTVLETIKGDLPNNRNEEGALYIVLGEGELEYGKYYRDMENDPKLSDKASVDHDETYFDNSQGLSIYDGTILEEPLTTFDKVGKYHLEYTAIDNPSTNPVFDTYQKQSDVAEVDIYVHRRPIADFEIDLDYTVDDVAIGTTDISYDLDHEYSLANKGIVKTEWAYRVNESGSWILGLPLTLQYKDYLEIYLKVTDPEGATSDIIKRVQIPDEAPVELEASLRVKNEESLSPIPAGETLEFYDVWSKFIRDHDLDIKLYDTSNVIVATMPTKYIAYSETTATKVGKEYFWNNIDYTIPVTLMDDDYILKIRGYDPLNVTNFNEIAFDIKVDTPIDLESEFSSISGGEENTITATTSIYATSVTVELFRGLPEAVLLPMVETANDGICKTWGVLFDARTLDIGDGLYHAEFTGAIPSGKTEVVNRQFELINLGIESFEVIGAWSYWDGKTDYQGKRLSVMPHRFLSLESISMIAVIRGTPDSVSVTLSPELEAMTFTDLNGTRYNYKEILGYEVFFPLALTLKSYDMETRLGTWSVDYVLPLAPSTLSWEDVRNHPTYLVTLEVTGGENSVRASILDLEITGNVYDRISLQPEYH